MNNFWLLVLPMTVRNAWHSLLSTFAWAVVWFVIFVFSTLYVQMNDGVSAYIQMSALSLTVAVFAGHATKLISYMVGSDTDFRHLFINDTRRVSGTHFARLLSALIFLGLAIRALFKDLGLASKSINVISEEFAGLSVHFYGVVGFIFLAQIVFSWPDPHEAA